MAEGIMQVDYYFSWQLRSLITELLEQAIAAVSKLSDAQQDAIAS